MFFSPKRRYCQYKVELFVNAIRYEEVVVTKDLAEVGDFIEVRYTWEEDENKPWMASIKTKERLKELTIGGSIGLVLGGILAVLKALGMI